ncbi:C45 family autoproteolytic acyltransferase/hydrolase [Variovorax sp. J22G21]|uniref:C45 family autoproteolytic acyltransferase/hydolase n=1 Tax=Variovorax fucosicus TaxID=3053517 RepID=UPI002578F880|nr:MULTISPECIES: C45 family peptidase [unclassified Variovorax]MDM0042612.1 C45 family autoproteolytic acyltransferase/hydrolase [Variovorax sp. J22R193]MDM0061217.1 C45 family autoproteolytic acyltransferase/hydrolase [Variovorax sp. J22G21]
MPELTYFEIQGAPFETGRALGRFGAAAMHGYARQSPAWASVLHHRGTPLAEQMAALARTRFPRVWDELQGLAAGLELPFEDVFLWNCRGDLWAMAPDGCTTVQEGGGVRRITHNEDGDPAFAGCCAIAAIDVEGGAAFASFVYPGSLPGHTFAVTEDGLAMAVNNLRCLNVRPGVPRMVLTRALLEATSLDEALQVLRSTERAGGFHLTLAHRNAPELLSVEFSSQAFSVVEISGRALHANHARHAPLRDLPQIVTGSSRHRQQRGDALLAGDGPGAADPLHVLADHGDAAFPILRTDPADSDGENTMATVDILVGSSHIEWQVHEHPMQPPRFHMIDGHASNQKSRRRHST